MKLLKPQTKHAVAIAAVGLITILVNIYVFREAEFLTKQAIASNKFSIRLAQVLSPLSALSVGYSEMSLQDLSGQIEQAGNDMDELLTTGDVVLGHESSVELLRTGVTNLESLMSEYRDKVSPAPDSLQALIKAQYTSRIGEKLRALSKATVALQKANSDYVTSIEEQTKSVSSYRNIVLFISLVIFSGLTFFAFRKSKYFEHYKRSAEDKFAKEAHRIESLNRFVETIANGQYTEAVELDKGDRLADAMLEMRNKLMLAAESDRKQNWATQGMAELGTLLRDADSAEKLYQNITRFCVKYSNSNQASLFVLNEDNENNRYLELVSAYAYDKRKFVQKSINLGEGLAGQAVLEAQTIYMTKVPDKYVHITSGLGDAPPTAIIIVPLKLNEKVYGVLEMASFHTYQPFEIEFLEKLAESVASSISAARINDRTKDLLQKSQQQMEELRAQEEEVRQNMEELSATQEQMARQMEETKKMADNLQVRESVFALTTILSESDLYGNILLANEKLLEVSKYTREELIGKPHNIFRHPDMPSELFRIFWDTIKRGQVFRGVIKNRAKDGSHYWVDATIVPVTNHEGKVIKYIGARYHITDDNFAESMYNQQALKLNLPLLGNSIPTSKAA